MPESNKDEIANHKRKVDQLITMHSILSQRYDGHCTMVDLVIWCGSIVLLIMAWFDPGLLKVLPFQLSEPQLKLLLGLISAVIFVASLLPLVLQWRNKALEHNGAALSLAELKLCLRQAEKSDSATPTNEVISQYNRVMDGLCKIPENKFLRLKQEHLRKVAFSKFLDRNPGRLYLLNKVCFFLLNLRCGTADDASKSNTSKVE